MIYFFDNDLQLQKVVTSKNVISSLHEHEMNGIIINNSEFNLDYANKFLVIGISYFGYYYKDNFYIHKIKRVDYNFDDEVVTITGRHIFFEDMLYGDYIKDVRPVNRDVVYILNQTISENTRWQTVMTDTSKLHTTNYYWVPPMEVLNDLTENLGIEYEPKILFDGQKINGYQLIVSNRLGEDKPKRINFDSRVLNLKYEVDYSEVVTALYGHGKGEEVGDGYGRRINFSSVNFSRNGVISPTGQLYMENPNVTAQYGKDDGSPKFGRIIFEEIEDESELADATYEAYLEQSRPKMLFEASVVDLGDVDMGDGVLIISRGHDIYFNARIHKVMIDLLNPEDADVELGDYSHFKESKVQRKTRENNNQYKRETSSRIQQLKKQFDERFDGEVNQMREEFEQALIDVHAEIEASEQRHNDEWENHKSEIDGNIERIVGGSLESLETNLLDVNSRLLSKLDEADLQPLYGRIDDAFSDISDVSGDLNTARSELQEQLDEVKAETETKITTLSESIEYIDGQLEAKLNRTEIEPIQNKITEYGTTLDANAESIGLLQDKTELHDNDITKWSNLTESNAEEIGRTLTRISEIDGEVEQAQTEISANADGVSGLLTRVSSTESSIADINLNVDGITADFVNYKKDIDSDVGVLSAQVASYEASVDGFRAEVVTLRSDIDDVDSWMSEKGAIIDGNADAIRTRIWKNDIDDLKIGGRNLISKSDVVEHFDEWKGFNPSNISVASNENLKGYLWIYRNDVEERSHVGAESPSLTEDVIEGRSYTVRFKVTHFRNADPNMVYMYLMNDTPNSGNQGFGSVDVKKRVFTSNVYSDEWIYEITFVPYFSGPAHMLFGTRAVDSGNQVSFYIKEPMLVEGTHIQGDWTPAPEDDEAKITQLYTDITVEAGRINTLLTRTSSVENSIADINTSVDGITADFANYKQDIDSDVVALSSQVASYEASVSGFRAEVGTLQGDIDNVDSWIAQKGSIIDGNADAISARVWNKDIDDSIVGVEGRNLITGTSVDETDYNFSGYNVDIGKLTPFGLSELRKGGTFTISVDITESENNGAPGVGVILQVNVNGTLRQFSSTNSAGSRLNAGETGTIVYTFNVPSDDYDDGSGNVRLRNRSTYSGNNIGKFACGRLHLGSKSLPYAPAPEDFLQHTDFILESDGFFLGGKYVGGDHYSTAIVGSRDGIDILADRMRVTGDLLVRGDVESYALSAVHGDITNLRSKLLTTNVVKSDHLNVGSALANKFNANSAFISRLEVQAANIRDLTGIHIRGGMLDSLNGRTRFNLDTGLLQMDNTDFRLGGNAKIVFTDRNNRMEYSNRGITAGIQFDHSLGSDGRPMTAIGVSDGAFNVNDTTYRGLIVHSLGTEGLLGYGSSLITQDGGFYTRTDRTGSGINFRLHATGSGAPRGIYPQYTGNYDYNLGSALNPWTQAYIRDIRTTSELWIRDWNSSGGWKVNTMADSGRTTIVLRGVNTGSWNYNLGSTTYRINGIYLNNSPNVSSDERFKEDIKSSDLGLDFINGIEIKSFRKKVKEADINEGRFKNHVEFGLIAQQLRDNLISHNIDVEDVAMLSIDDDGYYGVQHEQLIAPTMRAVQELDLKVESNEQRIKRLENEIEILKGE